MKNKHKWLAGSIILVIFIVAGTLLMLNNQKKSSSEMENKKLEIIQDKK